MVDTRARSHRPGLGALAAGLAAPFGSAALGVLVYRTLTQASADRDADFVLRLSMVGVAMAAPPLAAVFVALRARRKGPLGVSGKVGLLLAVLALGMLVFPIRGIVSRARQARNLALENVAAPAFDTVDLEGRRHRLADHEGDVVLVNIWATWCPPCRREMPDLDELYRSRKDRGFVVFGLSTEDVETQRSFARDVAVSYPLLTIEGEVPETYRTTARYPANFLIDRKGRLQPAPSTEQPFENLVAAVDALLVEPR